MQDIETYYIPQNLDTPAKYLFWTLDEYLALICPIFFGFLLEQILFFMVISFVLYKTLRKLKSNHNAQIFRYSLYWYFPILFQHFKETPCSSLRRYVG